MQRLAILSGIAPTAVEVASRSSCGRRSLELIVHEVLQGGIGAEALLRHIGLRNIPFRPVVDPELFLGVQGFLRLNSTGVKWQD
jgi:hypothetical protein